MFDSKDNSNSRYLELSKALKVLIQIWSANQLNVWTWVITGDSVLTPPIGWSTQSMSVVVTILFLIEMIYKFVPFAHTCLPPQPLLRARQTWRSPSVRGQPSLFLTLSCSGWISTKSTIFLELYHLIIHFCLLSPKLPGFRGTRRIFSNSVTS